MGLFSRGDLKPFLFSSALSSESQCISSVLGTWPSRTRVGLLDAQTVMQSQGRRRQDRWHSAPKSPGRRASPLGTGCLVFGAARLLRLLLAWEGTPLQNTFHCSVLESRSTGVPISGRGIPFTAEPCSHLSPVPDAGGSMPSAPQPTWRRPPARRWSRHARQPAGSVPADATGAGPPRIHSQPTCRSCLLKGSRPTERRFEVFQWGPSRGSPSFLLMAMRPQVPRDRTP